MRTISASELERRGLAALDGMLDGGPVRVIRGDRTAFVAMSADEHARLSAGAASGRPASIWELLLVPPRTDGAGRTREEIDAALDAERESWERR